MGDPGLLYCVAGDRGPMEGGSDEDAFHISGRRFAPRIRGDRSGGHDLPEEAMSCVRRHFIHSNSRPVWIHSAILPPQTICPFLVEAASCLSAGIEHDNPEGP